MKIGDVGKLPELLHSARIGDIVTINGDDFTLTKCFGGICLISTDSRVRDFIESSPSDFTDSGFLIEGVEALTYEAAIRHVRVNGRALLTTIELVEALHSGNFTVDKFREP